MDKLNYLLSKLSIKSEKIYDSKKYLTKEIKGKGKTETQSSINEETPLIKELNLPNIRFKNELLNVEKLLPNEILYKMFNNINFENKTNRVYYSQIFSEIKKNK